MHIYIYTNIICIQIYLSDFFCNIAILCAILILGSSSTVYFLSSGGSKCAENAGFSSVFNTVPRAAPS